MGWIKIKKCKDCPKFYICNVNYHTDCPYEIEVDNDETEKVQ